MGSAWLAISGLDTDARDRRFAAAARWLPFTGGVEHRCADTHRSTELRAWTIAPAATRGVAFARAAGGGALAFDGWLAEDDATPLATSVAEVALAEVAGRGPSTAAAREGQWSWCYHDGDSATAASGFLQGLHVYVAEADGVVALSNRALLAATAIAEGTPRPLPDELGWLLTGIACPFGTRTCWPGVALLEDGCIAVARDGTLQIERWAPAQPQPTAMDWDDQAQQLADRTRTIARLDGIARQMAVTGGKDSRLVLAAAHHAGCLDAVDQLYLRAVDHHPDARVAARLAAKVGRNLVRMPPPTEGLDIFEAVTAHLFGAEAALGAWDHKAAAQRPAVVGVHGNYGEIFKSHIRPSFLLGWPVARRFYLGNWLNPNGLLAPPVVARYRAVMQRWLQRCRDEGTPLDDLHDRWHREARMGRWLGQTLQFDAAALPAINPLPSRSLLSGYLSLPWRDRRDHRVHFELTRRLGPDLWRMALANDRWAARLRRGQPKCEPPVTGNVLQVSPQLVTWQRQGDAIAAYLLNDRDPAGFFDLVLRNRLAAHLARARAKPGWRLLEPIYAMVGIRMAMQDGIEPAPFVVVDYSSGGS